ncbi:MAG: Crp/Fnr family transcriptional regulator [Rhizomicrobium sp.]|jgi:CRP-like cAMP-binding protein
MDRAGVLGCQSVPPGALLPRRLERFADLSAAELSLLESLPAKTEEFFGGTELVAEGQCLDAPRLLLSGWACRFRLLPDGRRQIFEFTLPGDLYGLCLRPQAIALTTAIALTPVRIADASALAEAIFMRPDEHPGLTAALHSTASLEEAYLLNQLMRVGRQTAYERTAHLILELHERLSVVGIAGDTTVPIPLTQEILADALGLSVVHLNRTLQQLRRDQLIEFRGGQMRLLQPDRLREIADFKPPRISQHVRAA